jgi:hypothetical protein
VSFQIGLFYFLFSLHCFLFFLLKRVSEPSRDPGSQYQRSLLGLDCLFFIFFIVLEVHVACIRPARVYTPSDTNNSHAHACY